MGPKPLYHPENLSPAYELRYSWTGWPTRGGLPPEGVGVLERLNAAWEDNGLRRLEQRWAEDRVQITFSTKTHVSPVFLASRAKGRLQHELRKSGLTFAGFSRKVAVRTLGHNRREHVEAYIASQVDRERFCDPSFEALIREFTVVCPDVDLSQPTETAHGRYWYNVHIVLVTAERHRVVDRRRLTVLRDTSLAIAEKKGYGISRLSVMPDHLHTALRGNLEHSPLDIALAFQNNLAYALGQLRIWADTFYTGTFGEYDMGAVRGSES